MNANKRLKTTALTLLATLASIAGCKEQVWVQEQRYLNGNLKMSREFIKDAQNGCINHGTYTRYYENGFKAEEGQYVQGKKHGPWTKWDDAGNQTSEEVFDHGDRVPPEKKK